MLMWSWQAGARQLAMQTVAKLPCFVWSGCLRTAMAGALHLNPSPEAGVHSGASLLMACFQQYSNA